VIDFGTLLYIDQYKVVTNHIDEISSQLRYVNNHANQEDYLA